VQHIMLGSSLAVAPGFESLTLSGLLTPTLSYRVNRI